MELGSWITVYDLGGGCDVKVGIEYLNEIKLAYTKWKERGIDTVLDLECLGGAPFMTAASRIANLYVSGPEDREFEKEFGEAYKVWDKIGRVPGSDE